MTAPAPLPPGFDSPEHFLSAIIDSSDDAIVTKDLNGIVTSWNKAAERIFGYTAEEMIGQPILRVIPTDRKGEEPAILQRLRRGERVDHFDTKRLHKDGRELDISLTISPVKNRAGEIVGASKVARDISLQKQAERILATANDETMQQNRQKDEFLTTLSHELRTPLQSIVGWVQILQGGDLVEGELEQGLEVIGRAAKSQQHIIEDLLDMSRILSGKVRLDVQKVELGTVLEAALETVRPAAQAKGIRLHSVIDPVAAPVSGDPQRIQQVFWNLLSNAIKFTPRGGRIEVLLQRVNSHLQASIADTGIGIASDFLPHVFDRFRQADASTTRTHGGLGLGLAIVKQLVELHGGSVFAKSPGLGKGATFSVVLPLAAVAEPSFASSPRDVQGNEANQRPMAALNGITVLVVDDDNDSRAMVAKTLEKAGASVSTASSADEALRTLDESLPQVLVSDIGMPEKNGYALLEELRARPAEKGGKIPAAALTAYTRVEDRVQAMCAGFQILLPKPVDATELVATVAALAKQAK
ncbi:MAG TPA: PAS domain S-box protein [Chthoniobacteraceae bacterium]|jgi:PAS domain S-box-containing protein|nr:PAS domain S-box protein [Chthoniobacteraceae bacterium]